MMDDNIEPKKVLLISIVLILAVGTVLLFYSNYRVNKLDERLTAQLLLMNRDILTNLNELQTSLETDILSLSNNLSIEMELIDASLKNFREKNERDIDALNSLIDEIERQSNIKLDELQSDLKSIQVKSKDFSSIIDDVVKSVVSVGTNVGQGSGVVIDGDGFIATNYHVVERASIIRVLANDGKIYNANLIGFNNIIDLAVLRVDANLKSLRFDDSDDVKVGERVIALGNPAGLSFTVTEGIVSAVHRKGPNNLNIYLQTDVPINPGNSGGPLVNTNGRIIGINNFKIGGFEGLGFAIESNTVKEVSTDIIEQYLEQVGQ
jgi:S1-C subfamily serine protease